MYTVKRKRIDVNFVKELFSRIQSTVETMRRNQKFNGYRFKSYPQLIRGSETDEIPFKNQLFPITQDTNSEFEYKFTFFVFLQIPFETEGNHCEVDLEVRINPDVDFPSLTIGLELRILPSQTEYYPFDWENLFRYGKSIDDILYHFEHSFLEVPPIKLSLKRSPPAIAMNCMSTIEFKDCYTILWGHNIYVHQKDLFDKRLAIAMIPHQNLRPDILSFISKMSEESISEDSIREEPWPDFTGTIEYEIRRYRVQEMEERMNYERMIRESFARSYF